MTYSYRISVDAMGGDDGLNSTIPAIVSSLRKEKKLKIIAVGDSKKINEKLKRNNCKYDPKQLEIVNSTEIVKMDEDPVSALRKKKNSSMRIAIELLKKKLADACVSSGNTGALMATSKFVLKTLSNIQRPAIVYAIPSLDKNKKINPVYMLDLGANINCSSKQLFQFGIMGSILAKNMKNVSNPSVALLNIGREETKGISTIKEASGMLKNHENINYVGYVEGNDIFSAKADVIVCDGFTGNIALKTSEGTAKLISEILKESFNNNIFSKIAMLLSRSILLKIKNKLNINKYNGASLLGLKGIVIKSHGHSSSEAFETAIFKAIKEIKYNIPEEIELRFKNTESLASKAEL